MSRAEVKPPPEVWRLNGLEIKPFMKIKEACAVTGLSQIYLRRGVRDGTIPHIVSGPEISGKGHGTYMINMPALLKQLDGVYSSYARMAAQIAIQRTCTAAIKASEVLA